MYVCLYVYAQYLLADIKWDNLRGGFGGLHRFKFGISGGSITYIYSIYRYVYMCMRIAASSTQI